MCFFVFVKGHESHLTRAFNKGQGLKSYLQRISSKGWRRACAWAWEVLEKGSMPKVLAINIPKGWLPIAKLKKIYKDRLDLGVTWLKWLPHSMEQYGRLAPKSNKVNYQKLTLYFKKNP